MTLAALKRALTVGTKLEMVAGPSWFDASRFPWQRTIEVAQGNAIAFAGDEHTKGNQSWLYWPKSSLVTFDGDTFSIRFEDNGEAITYRVIG